MRTFVIQCDANLPGAPGKGLCAQIEDVLVVSDVVSEGVSDIGGAGGLGFLFGAGDSIAYLGNEDVGDGTGDKGTGGGMGQLELHRHCATQFEDAAAVVIDRRQEPDEVIGKPNSDNEPGKGTYDAGDGVVDRIHGSGDIDPSRRSQRLIVVIESRIDHSRVIGQRDSDRARIGGDGGDIIVEAGHLETSRRCGRRSACGDGS